ncbi:MULTISPECIES: HAD-IA family hydrolase [Sphingobium]|uniref:HAD-IA family hydrolase n=1 Tax=Sphingobium TaxID=165695 RepID=UPI0015EBDFC6|nr:MULTISPECIES: HAD-IA family hydrolase [Sphingobium]MCW2364195.1 phosphoglycolate phosphatase [Sphingobium sp. B10D3B]MCW2402408.1 phosphoglycolate phosphatase [Sphingobium sp. B10D7B]MCW2409387.1 phosphoglycolate phosphatase [Sphingobium xanthum]
MSLRLAIFDCDGTLVDSQHSIVEAMDGAFRAVSLVPPDRQQCLSVVGLSLPYAIARLVPDGSEALRDEICDHYKLRFQHLRASGGLREPLYPGIAELLDRLEAQGWLLAIATGKSERGLRLLLEHHGMAKRFVSLQTADRNPSKPDPAMIGAALAEAGVERASAVMIGDTSFDMLMARAAGVQALGVAWGYHRAEELIEAGAASVAMDSAELARHIGLS